MLRVGALELRSRVWLCPLERVSDVGFRAVCHAAGASMTFTEMIYASDLAKGRREAVELVDTYDAGACTGVQLLVDRTAARDDHGVATLRAALRRLEEGATNGDRPHWRNVRAVDLNFGCPAPSLARRGCGPAQLRRRSKVERLFAALAEFKAATALDIRAIGAKIRLGVDAGEQKYKVYVPATEVALGLLDYVHVHARHAGQNSAEAPTWEAIAECKHVAGDRLAIVANGDVRTAADLRRVTDLTGCDAIAVGRAAMHNPFVFRSLITAHENSDPKNSPPSNAHHPSVGDVEAAARAYLALATKSPGYDRYAAFHLENFVRLRAVAAASFARPDAGPRQQDGRPSSSTTVVDPYYSEKLPLTTMTCTRPLVPPRSSSRIILSGRRNSTRPPATAECR